MPFLPSGQKRLDNAGNRNGVLTSWQQLGNGGSKMWKDHESREKNLQLTCGGFVSKQKPRKSLMSDHSPFRPGLVLENRYKIQRVLGRGGFGKTYLAENLNRFGELCVLKELAPQIRDPEMLHKAAELFRREAETLYRLNHPQIPEFRELMTVEVEGGEYLLMVQQYIEGPTYQELLAEGRRFQPQEVLQLLYDLLPVLSYIHDQGVIHRDIAPDNLICDRKTQKPILIDFGGVKQIAATAIQKYTRFTAAPTRLEKAGYTPDEQKLGHPTPQSDLYSLGATAAVLLTGKQPCDLFDDRDRSWHWQSYAKVNRDFGQVLNQLLADQPRARFDSAEAAFLAIKALLESSRTLVAENNPPVDPAHVRSVPPEALTNYAWSRWQSRLKTLVVAPKAKPNARPSPQHGTQVVAAAPAAQPIFQRPDWKLPAMRWPRLPNLPRPHVPMTGISRTARTSIVLVVTGVGFLLLGFWGGPTLVSFLKTLPKSLPVPEETPSNVCQQLNQKLDAMNNSQWNRAIRKIDREFYRQHPELQERALSNDAKDAPLRQSWCKIGLKIT